MATNRIYEHGRKLSVTCSHPTTPSSGQPVRVGQITGVALVDERSDGTTTVDFGPAVYDLSVKGVNDSGNSAVSAGDQLYYVDSDVGDGSGFLSKKNSGYFFGFALEAVSSGSTSTIKVLVLPSPGPGTADILSGAVGTDELADDALAASAAGRAKIADGFFDAATALAKFDTDSIANAFLLKAIADGAFQADAATRALFADAIWQATHLADGILAGDKIANVSDANTEGGIPVLFRIDIAGGAAGDTDVTVDNKIRVIDVWAVHTGGAGETSDTIQIKNGTNAITDAMDWSGADKAVVRAGEIDDAQHEIASGGILRVTTVDDDAQDDVGAGTVYVLAVKVA